MGKVAGKNESGASAKKSGTTSSFVVKKAVRATNNHIKKLEKKKDKALSKLPPNKEDRQLEKGTKLAPKGPRYSLAFKNIENWVRNHPNATE